LAGIENFSGEVNFLKDLIHTRKNISARINKSAK